MDLNAIQSIVGSIQRINNNHQMSPMYRISRINALIGSLNVKLELLNNGQNETHSPEQNGEDLQ